MWILGRLVNSVLYNNGFAYVWGRDTIDIIRNTDLSFINLECVVASKGAERTDLQIVSFSCKSWHH